MSDSRRSAAKAKSDVGRLLSDGVNRHRNGDLCAARGFYKRVLAVDPAHADALHLSGLIDHQRGDHVGALAAIDQAIEVNSCIAAFHNSRGAVLLALRRFEDAARALARAIQLDPTMVEAHNNLGNALQNTGHLDEALASYRQALSRRPGYVEAWNNFGAALRIVGKTEEAAKALGQALQLRPDYVSAAINLALVKVDETRWSEALTHYDEVLAKQPGNPTARANRAVLLLLLERFEEGWAEYEWRWRVEGFTTEPRNFPMPLWDGEAPTGQTLLLHAEQGMGSAIQFARFVTEVVARGAKVVLECPPPLVRLFQRSFDDDAITVVVKGEESPFVGADAHLPLMSLPHRLGFDIDTVANTVPYIRTSAEDQGRWQAYVAEMLRPRIGLVWAGNPHHRNDRNRSLSAALLSPLFSIPASFLSLQIGSAALESTDLPSHGFFDPTPEITDFADTAALIQQLDLVISVDTAVAHLAGALGCPVWLLLPKIPDWRWLLDRDDSPWYPSMRLFRQSTQGDWEGVIEKVSAALREWQPASDAQS